MLARAINIGICFKTRGIDYGPFCFKIFQLFLFRPDKHIVGKLIGPGVFIDYPDAHAVLRIGTGKTIPYKEFLIV